MPTISLSAHRPPPPPRLSTPSNDSLNLPWASTSPNLQLPRAARSSGRSDGKNGQSHHGRASSVKRRPKNSSKRKAWSKDLWWEQDYPDNWVAPTFLDGLRRNINVRPYDFYSLVAESTVIVQHLSSVVIFVTSFIAIFKERLSPVSVVGVSTVLTIAGWAFWEMGWAKREAATDRAASMFVDGSRETVSNYGNDVGTSSSSPSIGKGLGFELAHSGNKGLKDNESYFPPFSSQQIEKGAGSSSSRSQDYSGSLRQTRILTTAKSALLIYFTLLGLSPILRSLTSSISKDSIWAIATWLFIANFLGFDYGSGVEQKFPASFSTNAAITSAVVLASTLPSTTHVFSLMLFSIQVFGLFPVFRRYVRYISWSLHVILTVALVLGAAGGLGTTVGWGWAIMWGLSVIAGMGGCGWWMIDLQKYKNEIHGPWDPARPIIRRQWE